MRFAVLVALLIPAAMAATGFGDIRWAGSDSADEIVRLWARGNETSWTGYGHYQLLSARPPLEYYDKYPGGLVYHYEMNTEPTLVLIDERLAYARFDLSPLPPGARVARAALVLNQTAHEALPVVTVRGLACDPLTCSAYELIWSFAGWFSAPSALGYNGRVYIPLLDSAVGYIERRRDSGWVAFSVGSEAYGPWGWADGERDSLPPCLELAVYYPRGRDLALLGITSPPRTAPLNGSFYPAALVRNCGDSAMAAKVWFSLGTRYRDSVEFGVPADSTVEAVFSRWNADSIGFFPMRCSVVANGDTCSENDVIRDSCRVLPMTALWESGGRPAPYGKPPPSLVTQSNCWWSLPPGSRGSAALFDGSGALRRRVPLVVGAEESRAAVDLGGLPTGVWFVRVRAGDAAITRRLLLLR